MALVPVLIILLLTTGLRADYKHELVTFSNGIYQYVKKGSNAVLVCPYKPVYTWSDSHTVVMYTVHNIINNNLTVSNRLAISNGTNLIIRNVTAEDAGTYRCTTLSSNGPVWHDIILGIRRRPQLYGTKSVYNYTIILGSIVNISIIVDCYPKPTASWSHSHSSGCKLGLWNVQSRGGKDLSLYQLSTCVFCTANGNLGLYKARIRNTEGSVETQIYLSQKDNMELKINPSHAACKTSNTATIRCIHEHSENMSVLFHWNHYYKGVHIRRLNGSDLGNDSILSLEFCVYQDAGEYICSVTLNGRFHSVGSMLSIHGVPIITTKNASVNADEIELSVLFFSDPDIRTFVWYVNDNEVDGNNSMLVKHANVSVSIYGTNVSRQGYHTWILFDKKNAEDIISLTCRVSNDIGSSEISFSLKALLFILLSQDAEVTTILDYGTTESQELSIHQYRMLMYIILSAVMCVFITGAVTCIIVYKMRKAKLGAHGASESVAANRQDFPLENVHRDHGEAPFSSEYDEIDSTSYQSVTWRNYSLSDGNHSSGGDPSSVDDCEHISINNNKYDDLLESRCDLPQYGVCSLVER